MNSGVVFTPNEFVRVLVLIDGHAGPTPPSDFEIVRKAL